MNFDLSETQELFHSTVERFTRDIDVAEREKIRAQPNAYDINRWKELADLGLLAIAANADQDGLDGSLTDLSTIAESLGLNNAPDPWLENGAIPIRLISKANQTSILSSLIDGSKIAALAFAEEGTRYNLQAKNVLATSSQAGDSILLNGKKQFVMGGTLADYLLITANENDQFGVYLVPNDSQGITAQPYCLADGSFATTIALTNVEASLKLDISHQTFKEVVAEASVLCCAEMVGLGQLLLDDTVKYVKDREQFGVSIGSFQAIQHGLVDCFTELEQMRSMLYRILVLEQGSTDEWFADVMGAKSFVSEGANFIAAKAVQYHGAMGITDEVGVGHAMKRIIILTRLFGDSSANLNSYIQVA